MQAVQGSHWYRVRTQGTPETVTAQLDQIDLAKHDFDLAPMSVAHALSKNPVPHLVFEQSA
jgi:hypothetical protein